MKTPVAVRMWRKVQVGGPDECWPWTGYVMPNGYGTINDGTGTPTLVHRVAWEDKRGPIPPGMTIDHFKCYNKVCCNPFHLKVVTRAENAINLPPGTDLGIFHRSKKRCPQGHRYTPANTYVDKRGWRYCRECAHARYLKKKASA